MLSEKIPGVRFQKVIWLRGEHPHALSEPFKDMLEFDAERLFEIWPHLPFNSPEQMAQILTTIMSGYLVEAETPAGPGGPHLPESWSKTERRVFHIGETEVEQRNALADIRQWVASVRFASTPGVEFTLVKRRTASTPPSLMALETELQFLEDKNHENT